MSGPVGDNVARASGVIASAGGGTILKVKSLEVTASGSNTGTTPTQLSQFDMSFAPTTSDGKLLFQACMTFGCSSDSPGGCYFYDVTNTAIVGPIGDTAGSRQRLSWSGQSLMSSSYLAMFGVYAWHEPGSTDSRDYTIFGNTSGATTMYINRTGVDANNAYMYSARGASTFTITEYAADTVTLT